MDKELKVTTTTSVIIFEEAGLVQECCEYDTDIMKWKISGGKTEPAEHLIAAEHYTKDKHSMLGEDDDEVVSKADKFPKDKAFRKAWGIK